VLPLLFIQPLYLDEMIREWQKNMKVNFKIKSITLDIVIFAGDQAITPNTEMEFSGQFIYGKK
jgi:hypothetical protein